MEDKELVSHWDRKFKEAMVAKDPYTKRWQIYMDAYSGDLFRRKGKREYHADVVSNYVFSIIETIRPIMLDNDPKYQAMPRHPDAKHFVDDLQQALTFEWDREQMTKKKASSLITTLVTGNAIDFVYWDSKDKEIRCKEVNPFNIYPDPLATSIEDAEYIIYASYYNVNKLKQLYPSKASELQGADIKYSELVQNNDRNVKVDNQVLVLEVWTRDESTYTDEKDGKIKKKYPNGRVITIANTLGVLLDSKKSPYDDGRFPFILNKDYDIPHKFWGEGEVAQLLSPQSAMSELFNSVVDNAKATANSPWVVDKQAGIPYGSITNEPGLVIRKNAGGDIQRLEPPGMPSYILQSIETLKGDMEQVSGVFDTLKGNSETGVYTAQGILALQEAGQARVRLKVKLLEDNMGRLAQLWFNRMQQFWNKERWVRVTHPDGSYDLKEFPLDSLQHTYDIKITAGSTMPVNRGAMLDLMTRLAQTPMPDGQNIVDREAVIYYLPEEVKSAILQRMNGNKMELEQQVEVLTQTVQEVQANDESVITTIEQLAQGMEQLAQEIAKIGQKQSQTDEESKKEAERHKIQEEGYNKGFHDAEARLKEAEQPQQGGEIPQQGAVIGDPQSLGTGGQSGQLSDDMLAELENLDDESLMLMAEQNPELLDMVNGQMGNPQNI